VLPKKTPGARWDEGADKGLGTRIMGVDPGLESTGYGIIEKGDRGTFFYCGSGVIHSRAGQPLAHRLQQIFSGMGEQIARFAPQLMAVESPFLAKNVKSAMLLGQARGVAVLAAALKGVQVQEFSPLEVKQGVVGYGRATKEQIQAMIRSLLHIQGNVSTHAADALAVGLCLAHSLAWQNSLARASASLIRPRKRGSDFPRKFPLEGGE
jgi:crossover junction endodeoxyribonuclease RuvC